MIHNILGVGKKITGNTTNGFNFELELVSKKYQQNAVPFFVKTLSLLLVCIRPSHSGFAIAYEAKDQRPRKERNLNV